jgi:hypothetical protein
MKTAIILIASTLALTGYWWLYDNNREGLLIATAAIITGAATVFTILELGAKK